MDLQMHQIIRDYEIEELIGEGGFGAVYKACQRSVQRDVALKVILPQFADDPEFISRFDAEARIIARLEHAHIVPLYDYWREAGAAYLIMRWLPTNLHKVLDGRALHLSLVARILDQVGSALDAAHRKGIIHRDIKPDNIMMDEDNNAYLADFGIAISDAMIDENAQDRMLGSPAYASPEQLTNGAVTQKSDIYSLGVVLYELLTGERPFGRSTNAEIIENQLMRPLPSVLSRQPNLPASVNDVIQRATAKAPDDRYANVPAMVAAFHDAASIALSAINPGGNAITSMLGTPPVRTPTSGEDLALPNGSPPTRPLPALDGVETFLLNNKSFDRVDPRSAPNPYIGLRSFEESDLNTFFGRDKLVQQLIEQITRHSPFVAVVGPVGSGKSSILHAGLMPALRRVRSPGRWFVTEMEPGQNPLNALSHALASVVVEPYPDLLKDLQADEDGLTRAVKRIVKSGDHVVLVIDHFEELFGLVYDESVRRHVINSLYNALSESFDRFRLVVSMRADYYDQPLLYKNFGELLHRWTEVVLPLSPHDLEQAIIKPAEQVGVVVEPELVQAIMQDAYQQTGLLPLLQYTLAELFERRSDQGLTVSAYREIGGISGALAQRAEAIYTSLDSVAQRAAQQLFLRLITPDGTLDFTRRRVLRTELAIADQDAQVIEKVVRLFSQSHLFASHVDPGSRVPTLEIAHDMVFQKWARLRSWLEDSRDELRSQQRLTNAAAEWVAGDYNDSFLAVGLRLAQFKAMASEGNVALNVQERAYLEASLRNQAKTMPSSADSTRQNNNFADIRLALVAMLFGILMLRKRRAERN